MKHTFAYAAVGVVLAICLGVIVGSQNLIKLRALTAHGAQTQGTVVALEPMNHQTIRYSYRVDGTTYLGTGMDGYGNPNFNSLSPGDSLLVYYSPITPAASVLGYPAERLRNEYLSVAALMLLFPTIIVAFVVGRQRSRHGA